MSDILQVPVDASQVRTLRTPGAVLDAATAAILDAAVADARAAAYAEGEAAGRAFASADLEQATSTIAGAVERFRSELLEQRAAATAASLELARVVATAVLDRTPPAEAMEVLEQVRTAAQILDAPTLQVRLHPDDHAILSEVDDPPGIEWIEDGVVGRGEARIDGEFCGTELTRAALLEACLEALGEEAV